MLQTLGFYAAGDTDGGERARRALESFCATGFERERAREIELAASDLVVGGADPLAAVEAAILARR